MISTDRFVTISADLNRFFKDYSILTESGIPGEQDIMRYHAVSMVLFTILNLCFEMGEEVINFHHSQIPQSYRDIFRILYRENVIDEEMMKGMSDLVYYRNRLAHQYAGLDSEDIIAVSRKLDMVHQYVEILQKWVIRRDS